MKKKTKENVSRLTKPYLLSDTQQVELEENQYPGVVVSSTTNGNYRFARISKSLPGNPPQRPFQEFHPECNIYGNVDLGPPKMVNAADMWKDNRSPCGTNKLNKLKKAMGESYSIIMLLAFFLLLFRTVCGLETDNTCPTELWA